MTLTHATGFRCFMLGAAMLTARAAGQAAAPPPGEPAILVSVGAQASVETIHPGDRLLLAFRFEIAPHWHIYWKNPGDTGAATEIRIDAPEGFEVGEILWQRPQSIPGPFITYGYENEAVLLVPIAAPNELADGQTTFKADLNWLVCQQSCLMGDAASTLSIATSSTPRSTDESAAEGLHDDIAKYEVDNQRVREWLELIPRDLADVEGASIERSGNAVSLTGPAGGATEVTFFPSHSPGVTANILVQEIVGDRFRVVLEASIDHASTLGVAPMVSGVIALGDSDDDPSYSFEVKVN